MLTKLKERQHFVEGTDMYTFQDFLDLHSGVLTTYLSSVLNIFRDHIHACVLCTAKSFLCEVTFVLKKQKFIHIKGVQQQ